MTTISQVNAKTFGPLTSPSPALLCHHNNCSQIQDSKDTKELLTNLWK